MPPIRPRFTLTLAGAPTVTSADLPDDGITVAVDSPFQRLIFGRTRVDSGIEFTATDAFAREFRLSLSASGFALTVSKSSSAGNFSAILETILIEGIEQAVLGVNFDADASSAFSVGDPNSIDLNTPGRILIDFGGLASANTPASALSHRFVWQVSLGGPIHTVPRDKPSLAKHLYPA